MAPLQGKTPSEMVVVTLTTLDQWIGLNKGHLQENRKSMGFLTIRYAINPVESLSNEGNDCIKQSDFL